MAVPDLMVNLSTIQNPESLAALLKAQLGQEAAVTLLQEALNTLQPETTTNKRQREEEPAQVAAAAPPPNPTPAKTEGAYGVAEQARQGFLGGARDDAIDSVESCLVMTIPHASVRYVIGKSGITLKGIENSSQSRIRVQPDAQADPHALGRQVCITGTTKGCTLAAYLVMRCLHEFCGEQVYPEWMVRVKDLARPHGHIKPPHGAPPGMMPRGIPSYGGHMPGAPPLAHQPTMPGQYNPYPAPRRY